MAEHTAERQTGAENVFWDLSAYFNSPDDPAIEQRMSDLSVHIDAFVAQFKGRVAQLDVEEMYEAMDEQESLLDAAIRLSVYAQNLYSTDTANTQYGALVQKIMEFSASEQQKMVFFALEWNKTDEAHALKLISHPTLARWQHKLEADRRFKPYQLSEVEEQVLLDKAVTGNDAWTRFFAQLIATIRVDFDEQKLTLTQALSKLHNPDRDVRRKANDAITAGLRGKAMELSYIYNVVAADKASDDKRRGYPSWITSRNLANKAPDDVVNALILSVTGRYDLVARHYNLKRIIMGVDELREYDRYAPLPLNGGDSFYTWDEAKTIVLNAFASFSPRMAEIAGRFFNEHWIHAPAMPGKRGGAYCSYGVPSAHPLVFMNYDGTSRDVMTLAHELGHGIHAYLAAETHGIFGLDTPLTTAEMASTFAEMLVFTDLMGRESNPEARLMMTAQKIEDTFSTVFRQVTMNRFEDGYHTARRTEGELSHQRLSEIWITTQRQMFADSVNLSDDYSVWWSYIPHFLNTPGYVYAYAFGELLVMALFNLYQERGATFEPQFIEILKAGDSNYPDRILGEVGLDLNDLGFWQQGLAALEALVVKEEALARELFPERFA